MRAVKRFQVLSDIHLEFYEEYPGLANFIPDPSAADVLCLCGDIGDPFELSYARFLRDCAAVPNYERIFVIAGNHEFYGRRHTIDETCRHIDRLCRSISEDRVLFLHNSGSDLYPGLRVVGTTLWSRIDEDQQSDVRYLLADFHEIRALDLARYDTEHRTALTFLESETSSNADMTQKKVLVLTHHAPLLSCGHPKHAGSTLSSAFKNDLSRFIQDRTSRITAWFYGHDHYSMATRVGRTLVVSHQLGYPHELNDTNNNDSKAGGGGGIFAFDVVAQVFLDTDEPADVA